MLYNGPVGVEAYTIQVEYFWYIYNICIYCNIIFIFKFDCVKGSCWAKFCIINYVNVLFITVSYMFIKNLFSYLL